MMYALISHTLTLKPELNILTFMYSTLGKARQSEAGSNNGVTYMYVCRCTGNVPIFYYLGFGVRTVAAARSNS